MNVVAMHALDGAAAIGNGDGHPLERKYMASSVREHASACQARCPTADFKLSALPQASGISHALSSQDVALIVVVVLALVAAVVLTAIWSRDKDQRQAALAVLDRIIRWRP
jgi:hypothetical protein